MHAYMKTSVLLIAFTSLFCSHAISKTIRVPLDAPTIQAAIDMASEDEQDQVLVSPGTYMENIDFKGKDIVVRSDQGPTTTFIDGGQAGPVVTFASYESRDAKLEGFTITNGASEDGGGIYCKGSFPTIVHNDFKSNMAVGNLGLGGGISCRRASPLLMGNQFIGNQAEAGGAISCWESDLEIIDNLFLQNEGSTGGAIFCKYASPIIEGNRFIENSADHDCGAIKCRDNCYTLVKNNLFTGNSTNTLGGGAIGASKGCILTVVGNVITNNFADGDGGGIYIAFSNIDMMNNIVAGNSSNEMGGGIYFWSAEVVMANNTVVGNHAAYKGGGILITGSYAVISNAIVWNDNSPDAIEIDIGYHSELTIDHSNIDGGQDSVSVDSNSTLHWGSGMIDADPLFVDAVNHDYHLTYRSPCRDTGSNDAVGLPDIDFEGDPRQALGAPDMGADEFATHLYYTGAATPGSAIKGKFVGLPDTTPVGLIIGSGVMDPPLQHMWGDLYLGGPWITVPLVPIPADGVLVVSETLPGAPAAPYDIPMQALIGEKLSNLCVLEVR